MTKQQIKKLELLTISQAADILQVTPATLRNWDREGKLNAHRHPINDYRLYDRAQIENILNQINGKA